MLRATTRMMAMMPSSSSSSKREFTRIRIHHCRRRRRSRSRRPSRINNATAPVFSLFLATLLNIYSFYRSVRLHTPQQYTQCRVVWPICEPEGCNMVKEYLQFPCYAPTHPKTNPVSIGWPCVLFPTQVSGYSRTPSNPLRDLINSRLSIAICSFNPTDSAVHRCPDRANDSSNLSACLDHGRFPVRGCYGAVGSGETDVWCTWERENGHTVIQNYSSSIPYHGIRYQRLSTVQQPIGKTYIITNTQDSLYRLSAYLLWTKKRITTHQQGPGDKERIIGEKHSPHR